MISAVICLVTLYILLLIGARLLENSFIYFPTKYPLGRREPSKYSLNVEDIFLTTEDGIKIHGWYVKRHARDSGRVENQELRNANNNHKSGKSHSSQNIRDDLGKNSTSNLEDSLAVILLFHGNGGNITDRIEKLKLLSELGVDVFIIDYRGYGKSEGRPNEDGIYKDGYCAYRYLTGIRGVPENRVIVMGESLGGAVACEVASKFTVGGLILEATMKNARSIALRTLPILPPSLYLKSQFNNIGKISQIHCPVLIIYGTKDTTIPPSHSVQLYKSADEPKEIVAIEGASHNDVFIVGGDVYLTSLRNFFETILQPS